MIFQETTLPDVYLIELQRRSDRRGFFARSWCQGEFEAHGLCPHLAQCNISFNDRKGTLRGMHYQAEPYAEEKLVRCTRGAIYDVVVDLRSDSPAFKHWMALELTAENRRMVYIPKGLAHGFLTLDDRSEVFYQMSRCYDAQSARGVRWNDPAFGIRWPLKDPILSDRDMSFDDYVIEPIREPLTRSPSPRQRGEGRILNSQLEGDEHGDRSGIQAASGRR